MIQKTQHRLYLFLMTFAVAIWGFDYVVVALSIGSIHQITMLYFRYFIGFIIIFAIKLKTDRKSIIRKKDIPLLVLSAVVGQIGLFYCEYSAVKYIPIALITIILTLVPIITTLVERILFKSPLTRKMIISMSICTAGVILIIGADFKNLFHGEFMGYLLAFTAVAAWTIFNFSTAKLHESYSSSCLLTNQYLCVLLMLTPVVLPNMPPAENFTPGVIVGLLFLGIFSAAISSIIEVRSLNILGPTITSIFSNFTPLFAALWGFLFLDQMVYPQLIGGIIVISAGYIFIKEKGRIDTLRKTIAVDPIVEE